MQRNTTLDAIYQGLAFLEADRERRRHREFEDQDRARRDWADQQADVAMQMKLAQGGRAIERNQFGADQVRDASLLSDPRLFNVAGADIGSRRAPESGRTVNYQTRDGRAINVEAFNAEDLQEMAILADAAKAANALRLRMATESMVGQRQMAVEEVRNQGRVQRDEAARKANMVEVEPGVLRTPQQVQAMAAHKRANQPPAETVPVTLRGGQTINVRPDTAARLDQQEKDRQARKARAAERGTAGTGGKPAATSKQTKQQRVLAAVKRIMEESRAAGGTAFEHYIDNADTQYLDDPEISELRKPIIEELEKRRQLAAKDPKNRKWVRKAEYGDVYETLDPEARQQATPRGPATPSQSASNEDLSGLSTDELLRRLSNGN